MQKQVRGEVRMRLHSGIPVLDLCGEWSDTLQHRLVEAAQALVSSAHFDLVLNLCSAQHLPLGDLKWWQALEQMAAQITEHYGRLEVVGTIRQHHAIHPQTAWRLRQWVFTEEAAICRINGVMQGVRGIIVPGCMLPVKPASSGLLR